MSDEENFLSRWSRRKAGEASAASAEAKPGDAPAETPAAAPQKPEEEPFDLSQLPSIESLGRESDYSMFMHKAVPEDLRLKALRRMWTSDPALAAPELMDIHAWDYTGNEGIKPLVTPALEALAAAAREALERARKATKESEPLADSPRPAEAGKTPPEDGPERSSG